MKLFILVLGLRLKGWEGDEMLMTKGDAHISPYEYDYSWATVWRELKEC